ncbi:MAG: pantoate--beta-alanine ligase, partial [Bradyrhizobiaceae bacterium]|nr:pantoate--beta-alanine ligase [Bradyrhizobiaceae bacterium]
MPRSPKIIRTLTALDRAIAEPSTKRQSLALVPTMGALHAG